MHCPTLAELPPPPEGRTGWPWTVETPHLPPARPDGSPWPRISIVTPSYNQGQFIEETIRSILLQGYPDFEYIIIDGSSTDQSVEIIKKYAPWLTYWVSEKDRGQAHAINKGLQRLTGDLFNWINSDDLLLPRALRVIGAAADGNSAIVGSVVNFGTGSTIVIQNFGLVVTSIIAGRPETSFQQPGFWWNPARIRRLGGLDEIFNFVFDLEILLRYLARFPEITYTNIEIAQFRLHDTSKTCSAQDRFELERRLVYLKLLSDPEHPVLRMACANRLRAYAWWDRLATIMSSEKPRLSKAGVILLTMCRDPALRFSAAVAWRRKTRAVPLGMNANCALI